MEMTLPPSTLNEPVPPLMPLSMSLLMVTSVGPLVSSTTTVPLAPVPTPRSSPSVMVTVWPSISKEAVDPFWLATWRFSI